MQEIEIILYPIITAVILTIVYLISVHFIVKRYKGIIKDLKETKTESIQSEPLVKVSEDKINKVIEIKDEDLIELLKKRIIVKDKFSELDHNDKRLQLIGNCLYQVLSYGNNKVYQLPTDKKENRIDTLEILFTDGTKETFTAKNPTAFSYRDFFTWYYSKKTEYFHFSHTEGFKVFLRSNISKIAYHKKYE